MRTLTTLLYNIVACAIVLALILFLVALILWLIDPATLLRLLHHFHVVRGV
jgi:hypothetical protein